ncbi:MAG TPA: EamA family transporter [Gemmatimonadaceae bacterium]
MSESAVPSAHASSAASAHTVDRARRTASLALALGVFAIGWSAILVRWSGVSGMVSAFYRLAFASLVLIPYRAYAHRGERSHRTRTSSKAQRAAIIAGVVFAADLAFFNSAIMMTNAANATLLGVNAPIFVGLGTWLLTGKRPSHRFWIGFAVAFVGMIAIVGADVVIHPSFGFGDVLAVLGALSYGGYLLYVQRARSEMDTLTFSAWCVTSGAITLLIVCLIARQPLWGFSAQTWASLIGLALVAQLIGHLFIAYALGHVPVTLSSIVLLAQAPITALLAWPLLGEHIRAGQILGGALVLAGIAIVNVNRTTARSESVAAD